MGRGHVGGVGGFAFSTLSSEKRAHQTDGRSHPTSKLADGQQGMADPPPGIRRGLRCAQASAQDRGGWLLRALGARALVPSRSTAPGTPRRRRCTCAAARTTGSHSSDRPQPQGSSCSTNGPRGLMLDASRTATSAVSAAVISASPGLALAYGSRPWERHPP